LAILSLVRDPKRLGGCSFLLFPERGNIGESSFLSHVSQNVVGSSTTMLGVSFLSFSVARAFVVFFLALALQVVLEALGGCFHHRYYSCERVADSETKELYRRDTRRHIRVHLYLY
jgi:hypothetical protein